MHEISVNSSLVLLPCMDPAIVSIDLSAAAPVVPLLCTHGNGPHCRECRELLSSKEAADPITTRQSRGGRDVPGGIFGPLAEWSSSDEEAAAPEPVAPLQVWSLLMKPRPIPAVVHPRPVGQPKKNHTWDTARGEWITNPLSVASESAGGIKRPRGPKPKGKIWDPALGEWVTDVHASDDVLDFTEGSTPSPAEATPPKKLRPVGRPPTGAIWDVNLGIYVSTVESAEEALPEVAPEVSSEEEEVNLERTSNGPRKYRSCWQIALPSLCCVKFVAVCSSPAGISCSGCSSCGAMRCSLCVAKRTANVFGFGSDGCKSFKKYNVNRHCELFHPVLFNGQVSITESMSKSVAAHKGRIMKIMLTVLWLAANRMSMRKILAASALLRMQGIWYIARACVCEQNDGARFSNLSRICH